MRPTRRRRPPWSAFLRPHRRTVRRASKCSVISKAELRAEASRLRRLKESTEVAQPEEDAGAARRTVGVEEVEEIPTVVEATCDNKEEIRPSVSARFCTQMRKQLREGERDSDEDAASAYLETCFQHSVLPEPVVGKLLVSSGLVVDLSYMSMGNEVAKTFSKALPLLDPISLALSHNGFSGSGVEAIATGLSGGCSRMESLDLSSNTVRGKGVDALCILLSRNNEIRTRLKTLVLEHCGLGSRAIVALVKALLPTTHETTTTPCSLRRLCLSRNGLDEPSASALAKLARRTESLRELGASWTNLRGAAANVLCRGLAASRVETADLSWNAWYETPGDNLALSGLAYMLSRSSSRMTHLDLSHSRIQPADVVRLGKALESNRTLMGLHMAGNAGNCNASGFLRVGKQQLDMALPSEESHFYSRNLLKNSKDEDDSGNWCTSDNCWICQRWVEHRFCFTPGVSDSIRRTPEQLKRLSVSLRTSFDDFEAYPMKKKQGPGDDTSSDQPTCFYEVWRMVPPGRHQYSFAVTVGNRRRKLRVEKETLAIDQLKAPYFRPPLATSEGYARIEAALDAAGLQRELNTLFISPRSIDISTSALSARPRERQKKAWRVEQSVFGKYVVDTKTLVAQAFDCDYAMTNLPKLLGDDEEEARGVCRDNYDVILGAFRHFILSSTHQFFMGWNSFSEFVNATTLLESKKLSRADIDTTFFTSCVLGASAASGPKKALTRFQFLDVTVRLAVKRWGDPCSEAVRKMVEMLRSMSVVDTAADVKTFHDRAWTEETDEVIRPRLEMLTAIYEKYSGRDDIHGQMSVGGWLEFVDKAGLSLEHGGVLSEREAKQAFMRALQTVVDVTTVTKDKQKALTFVEFVEALLRVVDIFVSNPERTSVGASSSGRRGSQIFTLEVEDDNATAHSSCGGVEFFPDALKRVLEERVSRAASNNEGKDAENNVSN